MDILPPAPYPQSGVIPYRRQGGRLEVLLITSRRRQRWVIPKGIVEQGLTPVASACNEAYEEAGLRGMAGDVAIGTYTYVKWGCRWTVTVFLLAVEQVLDTWPEMRSRERRWLAPTAAAELVEEPDLRTLLWSVPRLIDRHARATE